MMRLASQRCSEAIVGHVPRWMCDLRNECDDMPDRIIRAGILTSEAVNSLGWPAEVFYRRLHSIADDYGRYDGRVSILRSFLYPLKITAVSEGDVQKWLTECVNAGVVNLYQVAGRPYVEVLKFDQRIRGKSKWPDPPGSVSSPPTTAVNGGQLPATVSSPPPSAAVCVVGVVSEGGVGPPPSPDVGMTELDSMQFVINWNEAARARPGSGGLAEHTSAALNKTDKDHLRDLWSKEFVARTKRALMVIANTGTGRKNAVTLGAFLTFSDVRDALLGLETSTTAATNDFEARKEKLKKKQLGGEQ